MIGSVWEKKMERKMLAEMLEKQEHVGECGALDGAGCDCGRDEALRYMKNLQEEDNPNATPKS